MSNLTPRQEKFAQLVSEGNTYYDSYIGSYNVGEKTSKNSIYVRSSELMSDSKISVRVKELQDATKKRNQATLDEVLNEMSSWLRFDPADIIDEADCVKSLRQLPKEVRKSISEIKVQELYANIDNVKRKIGEIKTVKFIDKRATADMFMKKFGQYVDTHKLVVDDLSHLKDLLNSIKE